MNGATGGEATRGVLVYVGMDLIGDAVMKLPFVFGLRAAFPTARITWLAGIGGSVFAREIAPLVAGQIDEVVENAGIGRSLDELFAWRRPIAGREFDLVIDTQRLVRTTLTLRRIRHRRFVSGAAGYLFSDLRPKGWPRTWRKPPSVAGQLRLLLELASGRPMAPMPLLPKDAETERVLDALLPSGPVYVGLVPGASMPRKCWPLERFVALARDLAARERVPVFVLGPAEAGWAEGVRAALPEALLPLQSVERITPALTMALGRRLAAAVANDCGPAHMLATANIPMVSLFGPTRAEKFAPATPRLTVIEARSWGGEEMERIPVGAVWTALEEWLTASH